MADFTLKTSSSLVDENHAQRLLIEKLSKKIAQFENIEKEKHDQIGKSINVNNLVKLDLTELIL